jgi:hypothetical protein
LHFLRYNPASHGRPYSMRRWLASRSRFGLRSVALVVALLGGLLAIYSLRLQRDRAAGAMILRLGGTYRVSNPVIIIHHEDCTVQDDRTWKQRLRGRLQPVLPWDVVQVCLGGQRPREPHDGAGIGGDWSEISFGSRVRFPEWHAHTPATDADVALLRGLPSLECLDLAYTHVTDAAIDDLCSLPRLRIVRLDGSRFTAGGLENLRRRLPKCRVFPAASP